MSFDYARYLTAKVSVDDRSLNRVGLATLRQQLPADPNILEIGAGLGTMPARLIQWGVLTTGEYTLLDVDEGLLAQARSRLASWAAEQGLPSRSHDDGLDLAGLRIRFVAAELADYLAAASVDRLESDRGVDVLIANAVLDLVDLPTTLPGLLGLIAPGGSYWFSINYDGETVFSPEHPDDAAIATAYHQDMDQRIRYGRPAGDSRTGRHLFGLLRTTGAPADFAGSSDWVVHPKPDGRYPEDEEYFLSCILDTIGNALADRMPADVLAGWLATRRAQLVDGELVYLAHQLDFVGRVAPSPTNRAEPSSERQPNERS